ncbi:aa3-type cytochrome c oxidase subunit IV [Brevundimonas kwangchunensis]|uniref:Aa3-type cytochrome c oxidase subunit IV n=1 Tax=Brevundimonas kwangchunensis TaxID=322163 RepID=A0ABP3S5U8_9CAUL
MADNHAHDDYVRGSMEISEQKSTFDLFMGMSKYGSLAIAASLAFLTIWFMPKGSFFGGLIVFVVMMAAGIFFLRKPKAH